MEETISLKEIFEVIKKRILMILAITLGAAIAAAVVSYFMLTPQYQASSQFIVNQTNPESTEYNVNDIRANVEIINTYNVIIKSPAILGEVIDELNLPYSVNALGANINVSNEQNSQVVTVTATDEHPEVAVDIANTTVAVFQEKVPEFMNVDNVNVLTEAQLSANPTPVSPNPPLNIAIAIVLGMMIGIGLAFLLEYLDNTITTEEDVEKHLGLPVLGSISTISEQDVRKNMMSFQPNRLKRGAVSGPQKETV